MKTILRLPDSLLLDLRKHLLPPGGVREEAAFLFVTTSRFDDHTRFDVIEVTKLGALDFVTQLGNHLELSDAANARVIKRAHDLGASLVEMHSHPGYLPAAFSISDRIGPRDTVPHMWWRLPKRPYIAIVVAPHGFDALVWLDNPKVPQKLDCLLAGQQILRPTNRSLGGWQ